MSSFDPARLTADLGEYRHGSILYMYLENFVTYDEVELYPGPHMNMVMGPNGTGKSSMVAAMAIGLGWHPTVLGRSKEVSEFIKYNTESAVIEIVLRVEPEISSIQQASDEDGQEVAEFDWKLVNLDERPIDGYIIVRRKLLRINEVEKGKVRNHSEWTVNGTEVLQNSIRQLVRWFNIQIDNLCQFLPQDRVSEFARMSPTELLMETQKAAASPEIVGNFQKLIEERQGSRTDQGLLEGLESSLESLKKQADSLQDVLQRHRDYESHLKIIKNCEQKRPWLEYNQARELYMELKKMKEDAKKNLDEATVDVEPLRTKSSKLMTEINSFERTRTNVMKRLENKAKAVQVQTETKFSSELSELIKENRNEIKRIRSQREKIRSEMTALRAEIRELEATARIDVTANERQLRKIREDQVEIDRQITQLDQEHYEFDAEKRKIIKQGDSLGQDLEAKQNELAALEDVKRHRFNQLRNKDRNVAAALEWLHEHRHEFNSPILGPIAMELSAKDPSMSKMVENSIGRSVLISFVTTDNQASEEFQNRLEQEKGIHINMIVVDVGRSRDLLSNRPELHPELASAGFRGWALDYFEATELIKLAMLDSVKPHLIPFCPGQLLRPIESISQEALRGVRKMVTSDARYEISNSRYSSDQVIRSNSLRQAEFLSFSIEPAKKAAIQKEIDLIRGNQRGLEEKLKELLVKQQPIRVAIDKLKVTKTKFDEERCDLTKIIRDHQMAITKLEGRKSRLAGLNENLEELDEEPVKGKLIELFGLRKATVISAAKALSEYKNAISEIIESQLKYNVQKAQLESIQSEIFSKEEEHKSLKLAYEAADKSATAAKQRAKVLLDRANQNPFDDELKEIFGELPETLHELDLMIAREQAQAELLQGATGAGAQAIESLTKIQTKISELTHEIAECRQNMSTRQERMARMRSVWHAAITEMVARINQNFARFFSQLGCLGEVRLEEKGDDYDQWEMAILVRFRDEEQLQRLSAQRQSGGEKSVSTILYLLALQELSKSPFRVVDEINQGMDATNERKVHALIVETATSSARKSQYFLITPKLLTALSYNENMHVLCVYNGEGMPEPSIWRDTQPALDGMVIAN